MAPARRRSLALSTGIFQPDHDRIPCGQGQRWHLAVGRVTPTLGTVSRQSSRRTPAAPAPAALQWASPGPPGVQHNRPAWPAPGPAPAQHTAAGFAPERRCGCGTQPGSTRAAPGTSLHLMAPTCAARNAPQALRGRAVPPVSGVSWRRLSRLCQLPAAQDLLCSQVLPPHLHTVTQLVTTSHTHKTSFTSTRGFPLRKPQSSAALAQHLCLFKLLY